jgi:phosphohistidine phosphatase
VSSTNNATDPEIMKPSAAEKAEPASTGHKTPAHTEADTLPPPKETGGLPFFAHPNRAGVDIFLMRHASAGTSRANPKLDIKRPLDKDGKRHCLQLAQVLNSLRISFDLIVSSPLKRCLQTAQLVGTEMGYEARILHAQALEPGAEFSQFQRLLHECRTYENVLMVGHNPNMTTFLGQLISANGNREHSHAMANLRLRKGAMARVTVERGPATLKWLLDPRLVRALYATSTKSSRRKTSRK